MKITEIASTSNFRLKLIRKLATSSQVGSTQTASHEENDLFLLEGLKLLLEAVEKKIHLNDVIVSQSFYETTFSATDLIEKLDKKVESLGIVPDKLFTELYTTDTSCGIVAIANRKHYQLKDVIDQAKLLVLADSIQDPGNLGTIIRTALAFDANGMILSKGSVDCYLPKVIRSSMGAILSLPLASKVDLKTAISELKSNKFRIIAVDAKGEFPFWQEDFSQPTALIVGNEGHGISPEIADLVDYAISIPISSACESLNVAVAAGIILMQSKFKLTGSI